MDIQMWPDYLDDRLLKVAIISVVLFTRDGCVSWLNLLLLSIKQYCYSSMTMLQDTSSMVTDWLLPVQGCWSAYWWFGFYLLMKDWTLKIILLIYKPKVQLPLTMFAEVRVTGAAGLFTQQSGGVSSRHACVCLQILVAVKQLIYLKPLRCISI